LHGFANTQILHPFYAFVNSKCLIAGKSPADGRFFALQSDEKGSIINCIFMD